MYCGLGLLILVTSLSLKGLAVQPRDVAHAGYNYNRPSAPLELPHHHHTGLETAEEIQEEIKEAEQEELEEEIKEKLEEEEEAGITHHGHDYLPPDGFHHEYLPPHLHHLPHQHRQHAKRSADGLGRFRRLAKVKRSLAESPLRTVQTPERVIIFNVYPNATPQGLDVIAKSNSTSKWGQ